MLSGGLHRVGLRGWYLHAASIGSVALCIGLWIRAKTVDQDERGNAERRALFVGLWAPQFWIMGDAVERQEGPSAQASSLSRLRGLRRAGRLS
ncbi:MAG: hypothetical protein ACJ77Z_12120 [Thermoleophilaceae bacterium]